MRTIKFVTVLVSCALLISCAAGGMQDAKRSGFLGDYSKLKPGGEDRAALIYVKPGVDFKVYKKIMFDRVLVSLADKSEYNEVDPAIWAELATYYQNALLKAVKGGYEHVDKPGPGVLRVRPVITGVKASKPVSNTLSTIVPVGMIVAGATKYISDDNLGTGEAATEIEVVDSMSGERLAAAVDRRQGGKSVFRGKWKDTKQAFDFWAERFRLRLDEARGVSR
jgi:hypothetical protein